MSSYTMQVREIIEQASQTDDLDKWYGLTQEDKLEAGRKHLFDFDYPIFDDDYKKVFERHFIRNFYMREIGFETEGLFKFQLQTWLEINMPYYNQLFESERLKFNPFHNMELDTAHQKQHDRTQDDKTETDETIKTEAEEQTDTENKTDTDSNQTDKSETETDQFERDIHANTPDNRLNLTTKDGSGILEYASTIDENKQESTQNYDNKTDTETNTKEKGNTDVDSKSDQDTDRTTDYTSGINETEDYIQSQTGKAGTDSYSKLLNEYRQTFLRIENQIFREMQTLFMLVY